MPLKPDEEFVKNCLLKHFGGSTTALEGEDPPDIYLFINDEKIAVEITRLSPVSFGENGSIHNRITEDSFGINLCNELDSRLGKDIPSEIDFLLTIYVPVGDPRKYKKHLFKLVSELKDGKVEIGQRFEFDLSGERVKINVIPNREYSQKKVVGLIVNKNSSPHIQSNAEIILSDRILVKVEKCKRVPRNIPKWLALLNDYWLADLENYSNALKNMKSKHSFDKVYVISASGQVNQIHG